MSRDSSGPRITLQDQFGKYLSYSHNVRRYVAARMRHRDPDAVLDLVQDTFAAALEELDRAISASR